MKPTREQKNEIRSKYAAMRNSIPYSAKADYDDKICKRFLSLASYRFSEVLLLYSPIRSEVNILPIAEDALRKGKRIAFPLCDVNTNTMTYHYVTDLSQLKEGYYGIKEPPKEFEKYDPKDSEKINTICFVPAIVYDKAGYRIGYGKGYYDRFLPGFYGSKIGIIYNDFILPRIPRGRYDLHVDVLVTEKGVKIADAD